MVPAFRSFRWFVVRYFVCVSGVDATPANGRTEPSIFLNRVSRLDRPAGVGWRPATCRPPTTCSWTDSAFPDCVAALGAFDRLEPTSHAWDRTRKGLGIITLLLGIWLLARDAESEEQARRILAAQASREERLAIADDVIVNDGSLEELESRTSQLHENYLRLSQNRD